MDTYFGKYRKQLRDFHVYLDKYFEKLLTVFQEVGTQKSEMDHRVNIMFKKLEDVIVLHVGDEHDKREILNFKIKKLENILRQHVDRGNNSIFQEIDALQSKPLRERHMALETLQKEYVKRNNTTKTVKKKKDETVVETVVEKRITTPGIPLFLTTWQNSKDHTWEPVSHIPTDVIKESNPRNIALTFEQTKERPPQQPNNARLVCVTCQKSFTTKSILTRHRKLKHQGNAKNLKCATCGKGFQYNSVLKVHMLTHQSRRNIFACGEEGCTNTFYSSQALKQHMSRLHREHVLPSIKCPICTDSNQSYASVKSLKVHLIRVHPDVSASRALACLGDMIPEPETQQTIKKVPAIRRNNFWVLEVKQDPHSNGTLLVLNAPTSMKNLSGYTDESYVYASIDADTFSPFVHGTHKITEMQVLHNKHGTVVSLPEFLTLLNETVGIYDSTLEYYISKTYGNSEHISAIPRIIAEDLEGSVRFPPMHGLIKDVVIAPIRIERHYLLLAFDCNFRHCHILSSLMDASCSENVYLARAKTLANAIARKYNDQKRNVKNFYEGITPKQDLLNPLDASMCGIYVIKFIQDVVEKSKCVGPSKCTFELDSIGVPIVWNGALELRREVFLSLLHDIQRSGQKCDFLRNA